MRKKLSWILLSLLMMMQMPSFAQEMDTVRLGKYDILVSNDTLIFGGIDSVLIIPSGSKYKIRTEKPNNIKLLLEAYKSVRKKPQPKVDKGLQDGKFNRSKNYFNEYEGKIIRSITFHHVDLVEGSVYDTTSQVSTGFASFLDGTHTDTRTYVKKRLLRFKQGEPLNATIFSENERFIRSQNYIEDAKIYVNHDFSSLDSVDVVVVTKDKFPLGVGGKYKSLEHMYGEVYTRNFNGWGHNLTGIVEYWNKDSLDMGFGAKYKIENIYTLFTNATIEYLNYHDKDLIRLNVKKPFATTDVKFGGELNVQRLGELEKWNEFVGDSVIKKQAPYVENRYEAWLGYSIFPKKGKYDQFINVGVWYQKEDNIERPFVAQDSNYLFHDKNYFLTDLTFMKINYFKTTKLFGYGVTEDVPYGYMLRLSSGYSHNEFFDTKPYFGISYMYGRPYDRWGYFSQSINVSTFVTEKKAEDVRLYYNFGYISPLFMKRRWQHRHFFNIAFLSTANELYLEKGNFGKGIRELNQSQIYGDSYLLVNYTAYLFTPWSFAGFKTSFSLFGDVGIISDQSFLQKKKDFYSAIGFAFHIKNESLTIPTFSTQVAFLPKGHSSKFDIAFKFKDLRFFKTFRSLKPSLHFF